MVTAAFRALGDVLSRDFRAILLKALGLTLMLFLIIGAGVAVLFWSLTLLPYPWLETLAAVFTGLGLLVLFFFLMGPVTSMFAGLFLDQVAAKVEAKHYPADEPGIPLSGFRAALISLQFFFVVLVTTILALPLIFTGIGVLALFLINAYLISREYFEMVAMRHMAPEEAKDLRKLNGAQVFVSGLIPAALALVPVVNLVVPIFSTSYFTHIFKQAKLSSV